MTGHIADKKRDKRDLKIRAAATPFPLIERGCKPTGYEEIRLSAVEHKGYKRPETNT